MTGVPDAVEKTADVDVNNGPSCKMSPKEIVQEESTKLMNGDHADGMVNGDSALPNGHGAGDAEADTPAVAGGDATACVADGDATACVAACDAENGEVTEQADGADAAATGDRALATEQDIILIQDAGFLIKVSAPGVETFNLPVNSMELVQEIYQQLIDREDTCHRTCFSLQLDGVVLDNFAELKTIEGLKEGSLLRVVEEPYTIREARLHVRHVRDLLKSVDSSDAYNGVDCNSLSFLNAVTAGDVLGVEWNEASCTWDPKIADKKKKPETVDCTPPEHIMPGSKERPLLPLHPISKDMKSPQCLKMITFTGWNPPPGNRKMHGDLLYLYVVTMEDKRYHITASTKGFYVNQSTQDVFNPKAAAQNHLSHSLIDLLNQVSPMFKKNFSALLKMRSQKHPFERVFTPYQIYSWLSPPLEHSVDSIRAEDAFSSRLGYEEHIPGQTRDWNEELQTSRELPRKNLPERLIRERAIFKVHSDFVVAATRGAMAVVDGNIMAINPGEDPKMQMFLWNNIFFSLGFDVKDHYQDFGGDAAAYVAPGNDLQGVRAYTSVDTEGLYTLGTVVIDYRGYRVTAQSIIPGILEREQEQSVVYGSIDFGKTVVANDKYKDLLKKTASSLKIRPHKVINEKEEEVELYSSVECKGIVGNDSRYYILDLLRTFPVDVNYLKLDEIELSEEVKKMGYPKNHPHKLACLRHELVEAYVENRYVEFVKQAAYQFQKQRLQKMKEEKEGKDEKKDEEKESRTERESTPEATQKMDTDEAKKIVETITESSPASFEESTKEVVRIAAQNVGSLSETEFSMNFNTDVFQPHVKLVEPEGEQIKKEKKLVINAAEFLLTHQIPSFVRDCLEHTSSPIDGYTLSEAMHHNGINMRYLGKIAKCFAQNEALSYLHNICMGELISRAVKHIFKQYIQGVETMSLSAGISHFLNCFLGSFPTPHTSVAMDELQSQRARKRNRKKNKGTLTSSDADSNEWATYTPKSMWKRITHEVKQYYSYTITDDSLDSAVEKYGLQRVSLLRSFCKKLGVQLLLKEYNMEGKNRQPFYEEDILNVFPTVKHIHPKATDAYHVFTSGQQKIQQGLLRDGYELISEALNLLNNVYGAMHPEIAACARLLARLNYIMGDYAEALSFQQRAVFMSERVLGIDHPNTITEYAHLALYCFANNQLTNALRLMYRARYLALLCHGENHPEVALFDSNIGLMLQAAGEFDLSLRFFTKALELNTKFFKPHSLKVAMSCHLVARAYSCKGDFRAGLNYEKEAYTIYKSTLGDDNERTKESSECLKHLTAQAVKLQKTMNDIYKGEREISIPPLQIQSPSLTNVLDTLNLINGIVFVHISPQDIERFREEMMKQHQNQPETSGDASTPSGDATTATNDATTATDDATSSAEPSNQQPVEEDTLD